MGPGFAWSPRCAAVAAVVVPLLHPGGLGGAILDDPRRLYAVVAAAAFLPPVVYGVFIRNVETLNREPWGALARVFAYAAVMSVVIAIALEVLFTTHFAREYAVPDSRYTITQQTLLVVVAAPVVEEFTKGLAIRTARRNIFEIEDGIVYGAAAGLGFSATENLIYELGTIHEQLVPGTNGAVPGLDWSFLGVAALRSVTSTFLHTTSSGILGYGIGRSSLRRAGLVAVVPYYLAAVLLHAAFNGIASFLSFNGAVPFIILVSVAAIVWTVQRIKRLDRMNVPVP